MVGTATERKKRNSRMGSRRNSAKNSKKKPGPKPEIEDAPQRKNSRRRSRRNSKKKKKDEDEQKSKERRLSVDAAEFQPEPQRRMSYTDQQKAFEMSLLAKRLEEQETKRKSIIVNAERELAGLPPIEAPKAVTAPRKSLGGAAPPIPYDPQNGWTVFWNPPTSIVHSTPGQQQNEEYLKSLREIGYFKNMLDFWPKVATFQKPSRILHGMHNLMVFRKGLVPAWESFPEGGCWIVSWRRYDDDIKKIDAIWETVMFGLASEGFGTPEVVGASLHIRETGYRVCIWNRDNRVQDARFIIADKLRMLLSIHPRKEIKYKFFARALEDGSTTARATPYQFVKVTF